MNEKYIFMENFTTWDGNQVKNVTPHIVGIRGDVGKRMESCIKSTHDVLKLHWGLHFCEKALNEFKCWCVNYLNNDPIQLTRAVDDADYIIRSFFNEFKTCVDHLDYYTNPTNPAAKYIDNNSDTVKKLFPQYVQQGVLDAQALKRHIRSKNPVQARGALDAALVDIKKQYPEYSAAKQLRDTMEHCEKLITYVKIDESDGERKIVPIIKPELISPESKMSWKDFTYVNAHTDGISVLEMAERAFEALKLSYVPVVTYMLNQNDVYKDIDYMGWVSANVRKDMGDGVDIVSCYFGKEKDDGYHLEVVNWLAVHSLRNQMKAVKDASGNVISVEYSISP